MNSEEVLHFRIHSPVVYLHMLSIGVPKGVAKMILDIGGNPKVDTGKIYGTIRCMWCDKICHFTACSKGHNMGSDFTLFTCLHTNGYRKRPKYYCCSRNVKKGSSGGRKKKKKKHQSMLSRPLKDSK